MSSQRTRLSEGAGHSFLLRLLSSGPRTAHRRARKDRDSILFSGWVRRLDVRQSPLFQGGAQGHTGPSAELSHRDHVRIDVLRTVPTVTGFVTEHEEHQQVDGQDLTARRLWLCEMEGGRIIEAVGYCSGEWDAELRARHAVEAIPSSGFLSPSRTDGDIRSLAAHTFKSATISMAMAGPTSPDIVVA